MKWIIDFLHDHSYVLSAIGLILILIVVSIITFLSFKDLIKNWNKRIILNDQITSMTRKGQSKAKRRNTIKTSN